MTGYPRKMRRARLAGLLLMSACCAQCLADDDELPGMALLEFLAEWETPDGQWVDPVELDDTGAVSAANADTQAEVIDD